MSDVIKLSGVGVDCPDAGKLAAFYVDDLEATEARVLAAVASKYGFQPNSNHCYVYADPAGHPFCLSTWGNPGEVTMSASALTRCFDAVSADLLRLADQVDTGHSFESLQS